MLTVKLPATVPEMLPYGMTVAAPACSVPAFTVTPPVKVFNAWLPARITSGVVPVLYWSIWRPPLPVTPPEMVRLLVLVVSRRW